MLCGPRVKMAPRRWAVLFADKCSVALAIDAQNYHVLQSAPRYVKLTAMPWSPNPAHLSTSPLQYHNLWVLRASSRAPDSTPKSTKDGPALSELTPPAGIRRLKRDHHGVFHDPPPICIDALNPATHTRTHARTRTHTTHHHAVPSVHVHKSFATSRRHIRRPDPDPDPSCCFLNVSASRWQYYTKAPSLFPMLSVRLTVVTNTLTQCSSVHNNANVMFACEMVTVFCHSRTRFRTTSTPCSRTFRASSSDSLEPPGVCPA